MKFKTVTYQKAFIIGPYLQEKAGFEIDIEEGETPKEALTRAKQVADEWHKENNPHMYNNIENMIGELNQTKAKEYNLQDEKIEIQIDNCTSVEQLGELKKSGVVLPHLMPAFMNKMKELTNQIV